MIKQLSTLALVVLVACQPKPEKSSTDEKVAEELPLYEEIADSEIKRTPDPQYLDFRSKPKWEYTNGLICTAMIKAWKQSGKKKYFEYAKSYADSMVSEDAVIKTYKKRDYNIDRVNPGKFLIDLYLETGEPQYKMAVDTLRDQMRYHPRTSEGGFWHKKAYPHQMWLDGLYMGSPFLAKYAATFDEPELFDDVANQIYLIDKYTWNEEIGLFHHGWDESREQRWSNPETGRSPHAWGRAMGWFAMALVDVLEYFPEDHPKRADVLAVLDKMALSIKNSQDPASGLWWQVMDQPGREGNYLEASCSSMFTYALYKAVNNGYLGADFQEVADKGYQGILDRLIKEEEDGTTSITEVCAVAGLGGDPYRDGTYDYYINEIKRDNDPKAVGPMIMAAIEREKAQK
ncbi:glycoside hydrolase family 88/105 protein [Reichenbachiella ulvae]|uniref:Glycoside hydrolase family 88 protein n=1 Tax=Reichenbachiella ulvae TaxID=2980104 RepID=A0ABT3CYU8_9BACT|nr:glycoside hydrolase family 88 protein [Reichenbachiella ulvae]MCV9388832.1 glycoside hydrolase family 88 protein [Reichenbachiella ulvae]